MAQYLLLLLNYIVNLDKTNHSNYWYIKIGVRERLVRPTRAPSLPRRSLVWGPRCTTRRGTLRRSRWRRRTYFFLSLSHCLSTFGVCSKRMFIRNSFLEAIRDGREDTVFCCCRLSYRLCSYLNEPDPGKTKKKNQRPWRYYSLIDMARSTREKGGTRTRGHIRSLQT